MRIHLDVDDKRVSDLLTGHAGRMSDWLESATGNTDDGFFVRYDREADEEGTFKGARHISHAGIAEGLATMAKVAPLAFGAWLAESDDDLTFDVAWQCIIFGKVIYG